MLIIIICLQALFEVTPSFYTKTNRDPLISLITNHPILHGHFVLSLRQFDIKLQRQKEIRKYMFSKMCFPNFCQLCNLSITQGYKIHIKECSEYLGALDKSECVICKKKLNNSSEMMLHLRYKHFLATKTTTIKTEPGCNVDQDISKENNSKIANADQKFRIKLPGRPCDKCKKMMKRNTNGFECVRCSGSSKSKNSAKQDEPEMDLDQDWDFNNLDLEDKEDQNRNPEQIGENLKDLGGNELQNKDSHGKNFLRCFINILICKLLGEK